MMPEAFVECGEFVSAVRRLRPQWLRESASRESLARYHTNRSDWQDNFWGRSRRSPVDEARINAELAGNVPDILRVELHERQQEYSEANHTIESVRLDDPSIAVATEAVKGSGPRRNMDTWRFNSADSFRKNLNFWEANSDTYKIWLEPFVDPQRVASTHDWLDFWSEIEPAEMPSEWVLWAAEVLTPLAKLNTGSPYDLQLTNYVAYADLFVSADRRFVHLVNEIADSAPFPIARAVRTWSEEWPETLQDIRPAI